MNDYACRRERIRGYFANLPKENWKPFTFKNLPIYELLYDDAPAVFLYGKGRRRIMVHEGVEEGRNPNTIEEEKEDYHKTIAGQFHLQWFVFLSKNKENLSSKNLSVYSEYGKLIANALQIGLGSRNAEYNNQTNIEDYFMHGLQDVIYEMHKIILRMDSMLKNPDTKYEDVLEKLSDLMNYVGFSHNIAMNEFNKKDGE